MVLGECVKCVEVLGLDLVRFGDGGVKYFFPPC